MSFYIEIDKEGPGEFVAWPKNLTDEFRGAVGKGNTPKQATDDLFDDISRMVYSQGVDHSLEMEYQ